MAIQQVTSRPRQPDVSYAAQYTAGASLEDVSEVARKMDPDAKLAEVPELGVLLVRHLKVPDNHPSYTDYEVVPDGHYLVYSRDHHLLYESDAKTFTQEHQT